MLKLLRSLEPIDAALKSINTYLSLATHYTWIKTVLSALAAAMLGIWALLEQSWMPFSIVVATGAFVAFSLLPEALRKSGVLISPSGVIPSSGSGDVQSNPNIRNILLYVIYVEKSRLTAALLDKLMLSTPEIPSIDDRKSYDANVFSQEIDSFNRYCQRARRDLHYTDWGYEYNAVIQMVDVEADAELHQIDLPTSAPPFEYRTWFIARAKARQTAKYCLSKKSEIDLDIVVSLSRLREYSGVLGTKGQ